MLKIKAKKMIIITTILALIILPIKTYGSFADLEYPPDDKGKADYTENKAEEQKDKYKDNKTADDYIGKSSNNNLKTLTIENGKIEPKFNRQYVDYKVILNNNTDKKINIKAEAEDEKAKIEGTGEIELHDGINELKIIVTAENGDVQIYNLNVSAPIKQTEIGLKKLEIYGINITNGKKEKLILNPLFNANNYEYSITVKNEITSLDIETELNEEYYAQIQGEDDLQIGKNTVTIKITNKNDENKSIKYILNIERQEKQKESKKNINLSIIIGGLLLIMIIVLILVKKTK